MYSDEIAIAKMLQVKSYGFRKTHLLLPTVLPDAHKLVKRRSISGKESTNLSMIFEQLISSTMSLTKKEKMMKVFSVQKLTYSVNLFSWC